MPGMAVGYRPRSSNCGHLHAFHQVQLPRRDLPPGRRMTDLRVTAEKVHSKGFRPTPGVNRPSSVRTCYFYIWLLRRAS
jgi:hypothetical protein